MNQDLPSYYNERAAAYDKVYLNPDEQNDLLAAASIFQDLFSNKSVLEFACGTGYWTERIGKTAQSVYATDINKSVIEIAEKRRSLNNIVYEVADMYNFKSDKAYEGFFGGFIWSHIPIQSIDEFIRSLKNLIKPGGKFAFIDSNPVQNTNHDLNKIVITDGVGNTYQKRKLESGNEYVVLKNFPTEAFIQEKLLPIASNFTMLQTTYYWLAYGALHEM